MRRLQRHAKPQRTQADKKLEAINFVWCAMDHVIRDQSVSGASIALMKGVTKAADIAEIAGALASRREGLGA